jgi:hypothetical protein
MDVGRAIAQAVSHRSLIGDARFAPGSLGFVLDKVVLGQVLLLSSSVIPCRYHSTMVFHSHITLGMNNRPVCSRSLET